MEQRHNPSIDEVWALLQEQREEIAELRRQNEQLQSIQQGSDAKHSAARSGDGPRRLSRAGMLKTATAGAAATFGAGALMHDRTPLASANTGDAVIAGQQTRAEDATWLVYDGANAGTAFLVEDSTDFMPSGANYPATIGGWATGSGGMANGIYGYTNVSGGVGVIGLSRGGHGVMGVTSVAGKAGVYGASDGSTTYGVLGDSLGFSGAFAGVFNGNVAVNAGSTTVHNPSGHAILGTSDATHYGGLSGATTVSGGAGLIGTNSNVAGAYGGLIYGPLVVTGTKSAAVMHPDGTRRLVYCVEAPESYLEDVGEAQLVNGKATVHLRKDFAALIDTGHYYVFLTPLGSARASLALGERHGDRFVVVGNDHTTAFHYRIMAKRGDVTAERLARFDVPEPDIAAAMHSPEIPKAPAVSNHGRP